jgi:hypothetical protein
MLIRLCTTSDFGKPGEIIEVTADFAMRWVASGRAELAELAERIVNRDESKRAGIVKRKGVQRGNT